jgi:exodeoxyribonuclease V beta subunit
MNHLADPLQLPLDGIRVVEASAGTGKTFTIATLYLRLILERGLAVDEIVVATFTRAAAAELAQRLRRRLVLADALLEGGEPAAPRANDDGETSESRKVVAHAMQLGVTGNDLRQRARTARLAIDTAFIGTLHGFCHRVLAEFGFETGQALRQPELIEDIRELETEIVRDFWRRGSADAATARLLAEIWSSPEALAKQACDPRWRGREASVPEPDVAALQADCERARQRIAKWDGATLDAAQGALQDCIEHPPTLKGRIASLAAVHAWAQSGSRDAAAARDALKQAQQLGARSLDSVKPKGLHASGAAFDDLAALTSAHAAVGAAEACEQTLPAAHLLHDARAYLEAERPRRLAERNLMGHDEAVDRLARALADSERRAVAAPRIRARWKAALIDEFQDTDARQWAVVHALFGDGTLVLVGDPKQAIYGFRGGDVHAWLDALAHAEGQRLQLAESWRAGDGMCRAINALFSQPDAFIEAGIDHPDTRAAGPVARRALLHDGKPLPALQCWWLDPEAIGHAERSAVPSKELARHAIEQACVAWIANAVRDPAMQLRHRDGQPERLKPGHIAVLVNSNAEAQAMQAALGRAGVPACSNLRASVYTSDEAGDLALLLEALASPDDARRARAARASVLVGEDAIALTASLTDDAVRAALLEGSATWATAVSRHGPLPWLHGIIAAAAPRLLALPDGERRIANYLQLAELLQALHAQGLGLTDLATRFARARVSAADDADAARLRLDTDADAVTVSTVHAAKGLEYAVVLVPYAVLGQNPDGKPDNRPPLHWYHDESGARVAIGRGASNAVVTRARTEIRAEDVRKFYVAVTRASALCVLPWGPVSSTAFSPCFHLLHAAGRAAALQDDVAGCRQALEDLCTRARGAAEIIQQLPSTTVRRRAPTPAPSPDLHVRAFTRGDLERDWQTWSFSRLVRGSANQIAGDPAPGTGDSEALPTEALGPEPVLAGARFGTAVHAVFEHTDFAAWRDAAVTPESERALIESSLQAQGLANGKAALARAVELVGGCVRDALNANLPCDVRLCDITSMQRRAEIEFHLTLAPARTPELYALLHAHKYQRQRSGVAPQRLHGLLTGKIDLTFTHAGRFHLIDWKTNHCPPYDGTTLAAEIARHDYDLQWLIYTLALHRWLGQQLPDYDYDRHIGGVYYLFVRGMGEGRGVHTDRPPRELIEAMDALFTAPLESAA